LNFLASLFIGLICSLSVLHEINLLGEVMEDLKNGVDFSSNVILHASL